MDEVGKEIITSFALPPKDIFMFVLHWYWGWRKEAASGSHGASLVSKMKRRGISNVEGWSFCSCSVTT